MYYLTEGGKEIDASKIKLDYRYFKISKAIFLSQSGHSLALSSIKGIKFSPCDSMFWESLVIGLLSPMNITLDVKITKKLEPDPDKKHHVYNYFQKMELKNRNFHYYPWKKTDTFTQVKPVDFPELSYQKHQEYERLKRMEAQNQMDESDFLLDDTLEDSEVEIDIISSLSEYSAIQMVQQQWPPDSIDDTETKYTSFSKKNCHKTDFNHYSLNNPFIDMDSFFLGENSLPPLKKPLPAEVFPKVLYFKSDSPYRSVFKAFVKEGKFVDSNGQSIHTGSQKYFGKKKYKWAMITISQEKEIFISRAVFDSYLKHSSFVAGNDVLFAGMVYLDDGKLIGLVNASGHYQPNKAQSYRGISELKKLGVDFTKTKCEFI